MGVVRLAGHLPPELETELKKATNGETVKWAGRSTGLAERIEAGIVIAAGLAIAGLNVGAPLATVGVVADVIDRGQLPRGDYGVIAAGLTAFLAGVAVSAFGVRFLNSARRVVWAVTDSRMLRLVSGADACCDWKGVDLVRVEKLNWNDPKRRALSVVAREDGRRDFGVVMTGGADLEAAERAISQLRCPDCA